MNNPNSLLSTVPKGKYFLTTSFLQAKASRSTSWGWKSIIWAKKLLEKGVSWEVSYGKSIQCKKDLWVPSCFLSPLKLKPNHDLNIVWAAQLIHVERL
uniref:Reverse transcriptase zinc-binding domain-containing protein n=1 Tax=Manihot esculenta TaxID=3983 RepID=A0A2C9URI4_MANES